MGASGSPRLDRVRRVIGSPVGVTVTAVVLAVALRLPLVGHAPYPDEGGLLLVARYWREHGTTLYGRLFVDRPPGLLLFWKLALALGGIPAARALTLLTTAVLVVAAAGCGHLLAGRRGTTWAALAAAALAANPMLGATEVDGELLGAPLTMLACLAVLVAVRRSRGGRDDLVLLLAGALAVGAVLVKQNLVDAFVFGTVLALTAALTRACPRRRALRALGIGATGALLPLVAVGVWAQTAGPGLGALWYATYQFRIDAAAVMLDYTSSATTDRAATLLAVTLLSGMAVLAVPGLWALAPRARRSDPVTIAILGTVGYEAFGVAAGGSYWTHYLIGLVPGVALLAGAAAGLERRRLLAVVPGLVAIVISAVVATTMAASSSTLTVQRGDAAVPAFVRAARRPGDTGLVTYGHADALEAAGLAPAYPYLWTLPMRTLDPGLHRMVRLLDGAHAPTWVLEWSYLDSWGIDPHGRVPAALHRYYRPVATICGVPVYLHRGEQRSLPVGTTACAAG